MTQVALNPETVSWPADKGATSHEPASVKRTSRRRGLVLTDERARHPFRALLPPHVRRDTYEIPAEKLWRLTVEDVRGFASVYLAATAGILAFII